MAKEDYHHHHVPQDYLRKWQQTVDVMAKVFEVPTGLVMRVHPEQIEVLVSSQTQGNPYEVHERADLDTGLYCETVMANRAELLVENALKDPLWKNNPDVKLNMIFYLGVPLIWPDSSVFGTICILDVKERHFSRHYHDLLWQLKDVIEADFRLIMQLDEKEDALLSARKEWETTFHTIGDAVSILDRDLQIIRINNPACQLLNMPQENLTGRYCYEVFHDSSQVCADCPAPLTLKDQKPHSAEIEHPCLKKSFLVSTAPIFDRTGNLKGLAHFAKDITEKKFLESKLLQRQKIEAIGTLAGGIAHDFNNILTAILGYAELLQLEGGDPRDIKEGLGQILQAGNRAKDLVKQILTFSRQVDQERVPIEPHIIIKEVLKLLRSSLPSTIEIRPKIAEDCGTILADPTQIHQIIMNLCTNAYHAMLDSGGILGVKLHGLELLTQDHKVKGHFLEPGKYILLEVSDTGYGMSPEILDKIFEPYFSTKAKDQGTGLGLSLVHGIVKSYGGHIGVYSEPGHGSSFHVYFPQHSPGLRLQGKSAPQTTLPRGCEHILLVDDEPQIIDLHEFVLKGLGYTVTSFTDSSQALQAFEKNPGRFDIVITDMTMPKLTGADLAKRMKSIRPEIPIILSSGFSEQITENKAKEMGISRFVMKPVVRSELATIVRQTLDEGK